MEIAEGPLPAAGKAFFSISKLMSADPFFLYGKLYTGMIFGCATAGKNFAQYLDKNK